MKVRFWGVRGSIPTPEPDRLRYGGNTTCLEVRDKDDNLIIIEGNNALAQAYALNIIAIFQEYRWRQYVNTHAASPTAWRGLEDNDTWQDGHLQTDVGELNFWLGDPPTAAPVAAAAPTAAGA